MIKVGYISLFGVSFQEERILGHWPTVEQMKVC